MGTPTIDLSAGLQPTSPPSPNSGGGIDLSAGLTPAKTAPPPAGLTDNPNGEGTYQMQSGGGTVAVPYSKVKGATQQGYQLADADAGRYAKDASHDPIGQLQDLNAGFTHALSQTGRTAEKVLDKTPFIGKILQNQPGYQASEAADEARSDAPLDTGGKIAGNAIENILEFESGSELLKGYSASQKLAHLAPIAKALEKAPQLARILDAAITQGAVGTAQAAGHGASPTDALETGAITGLTGGVAQGAVEGAGAARGAQAANEAASADRQAAQTAYQNRKPVLAQRADAMEATRQATAQQGVKDVVKDSAQRMADRVNEAMQPPLGVTGYPVEGADFEPIDSQALAQRVNSFGDLANETRAAIKPIANKLDEATGGQLSKLQDERAAAFKSNDREASAEADRKIDELVAANRDAVTPEQYKAWRSSYSDSKVLDDLHRATESSFNGLSEDLAAQPGTGTRKLRGTPYQNALGKFLQKNGDTRIEKILGPDGLANLHRAANLVSTPELKSATQKLAEQVAAEFPKPAPAPKPAKAGILQQMATGAGVGAIVSHVTGVPHAMTEPIGAAAMIPAKYVLQKMVTNPRVGQMMDYAVRNNVTPKLAAGLIAAEIQRQDASQNPPQ